MAVTHRSIADAMGRLPSLVSASERGERVTITRHRRPAAELRLIASEGEHVNAASMDRLDQQLAGLPASDEGSVEQLDALRGARGIE